MEIGTAFVMKTGTTEMLLSHATNWDYHLMVKYVMHYNKILPPIQLIDLRSITSPFFVLIFSESLQS